MCKSMCMTILFRNECCFLVSFEKQNYFQTKTVKSFAHPSGKQYKYILLNEADFDQFLLTCMSPFNVSFPLRKCL
jgi:hypothetical protein